MANETTPVPDTNAMPGSQLTDDLAAIVPGSTVEDWSASAPHVRAGKS